MINIQKMLVMPTKMAKRLFLKMYKYGSLPPPAPPPRGPTKGQIFLQTTQRFPCCAPWPKLGIFNEILQSNWNFDQCPILALIWTLMGKPRKSRSLRGRMSLGACFQFDFLS